MLSYVFFPTLGARYDELILIGLLATRYVRLAQRILCVRPTKLISIVITRLEH